MQVTEWATRRIESSALLEAVAKKLGLAFSSAVRPGNLPDALTGSWMGHPADPVLTDVAIGAWAGATALDALTSEERAAEFLLAGLLAAIPTAATGLADLTDGVTRQERAVGAAHAIANVAAVALFAASWAARWRKARRAGVGPLGGDGALTVGGFLGPSAQRETLRRALRG